MFKNYFKTAFRQLSKNKSSTIINMVGLVLGLSSVMVLSEMVYQFLTFDSVQQNKERMYYLQSVAKDGSESMQTTFPLLDEALKTCPQIEAGTHFQQWNIPWLKSNNKEIQEDKTYFVDTGFFKVFSFPLKSGNKATALKEKYDVVLSEETAQKLFGNENPVGKFISADDTIQLTVTGVLKHISTNNSLRPDVLLTTALLKDNPDFVNQANWFSGFAINYLMLKPQANLKNLTAQLNQIVQSNYVKERRSDKIKLMPFSRLPVESSGSLGKTIITGSVATSIFILLIVIVNLINLNAGNMLNRAKEVAVKRIIGGSKRSIVLQFCIENTLIVFASLFLAFLFFYYLLVPQINRIFEHQFGKMELNIIRDYPLIIAFIIMGLVVAVISGSYPALHLASLNVSDSIKGKLSSRNQKYYTRNIFITIQFVLAITLVNTAIILSKQINHIKSASLGFNKQDVAIVKLDLSYKDPKTAETNFDAIINSLRTNSNVKSFSTNEIIPTSYWHNYNNFRDESNQHEINMRQAVADAGYFPTYRIPIIEGRNFRNVPDSNERNNVIINREAMKAFGWKHAVGKQIKQVGSSNVFTVIGVTENFNYQSLNGNIEPLLHLYDGRQRLDNNAYLSLLINKGKSKQVLSKLQADFKTMPARRPFSYDFISDHINAQYAIIDGLSRMTKYVAFLTIIIASMGMLGLISLFAQRRVKEIGIRKVLGASVSGIVGLLSKDFLLLVLIASVVAAPIAWMLMNGWLQNFAYRINIEWWMPLTGALSALLIALITVSLKAIKAAVANPVESLRSE